MIGFVVGGLPGARLLARLAITASDDAVLRRVNSLSISTLQTTTAQHLFVNIDSRYFVGH